MQDNLGPNEKLLSNRLVHQKLLDLDNLLKKELSSGAILVKSYPKLNEVKVVIPRRIDSAKKANLNIIGMEAFNENIKKIDSDIAIEMFGLVNTQTIFQVFFYRNTETLIGFYYSKGA